MIVVDKVVAGYTPEVDILRGMSVQARAGEIVTLLGPNGCGKSTLLKTIAGYLRPRSGRVLLEDEDVSAMPVHQKIRRTGLGFVPQTENVFSALSIQENLQVGGQQLARTEQRQRIEELCEHYPVLRRKFHDTAASLSGGERQRVAVARALVTQPACVLADEPTGNLDRNTADIVFDLMLQLAADQGTAVVMVTHDASLAQRCAQRHRLVNGRFEP